MSSQRLALPTCRHSLPSGAVCRATALHHGRFCRAHQLSRLRCRKAARAYRRIVRLDLADPSLPNAIARNSIRVRYAVAAGRMHPSTAHLLDRLFRFSASNERNIRRLERRRRPRPPRPQNRAPKSLPVNRIRISPEDTARYMRYVPQTIEITRALAKTQAPPRGHNPHWLYARTH